MSCLCAFARLNGTCRTKKQGRELCFTSLTMHQRFDHNSALDNRNRDVINVLRYLFAIAPPYSRAPPVFVAIKAAVNTCNNKAYTRFLYVQRYSHNAHYFERAGSSRSALTRALRANISGAKPVDKIPESE